MQKFFWLSMVSVLLISAIFSPVWAQDVELTETTTEDGFFTVSLPEGWVISSDEGALFIASSEATLAKAMDSEETEPESGEVLIAALVLPAEMMSVMGELMAAMMPEGTSEADMEAAIAEDPMMGLFMLDPEATPDEIADTVLAALLSEEDFEEVEVGEVEIVELTDELSAGVIPFSDPEADGLAVAYMDDSALVAVLAATAPGEMEAGTRELILQILATLVVDPSYGTMMMESMGLGQ